eukprot:TRINITY_DN9431_c0_g1_i10.p1 TRINITY_DN9431_c0_g1~~TRINITY_DN9431_c0_g1_i10.p1  ORF type:complete len:643 (+),score=138.68 TRINITY_DN9431_c0_g1_i10:132-2060(+)
MRTISAFFKTVKQQLQLFEENMKTAVNVLARSYKFRRVMDSWELGLTKAVQVTGDILQALHGTAASLEFKIIEPLDIFLNHYEQSNKGFLQDGTAVIEVLANHKEKLKLIAEQIIRNVAANIADERIYEEHKHHVTAINDFIDEHEHAFRANVGFISKNEENRMNFEYKLFSKFIDILEELAKNFLENKAKVEAVFSNLKVSPAADHSNSKPLKIFEKITYKNPVPIRKRSDGTDSSAGFPLPSISSVESVISDIESEFGLVELPAEDTKLMQFAFGKLLSGEDIEDGVKQKLVDSLQYSDGRLKTSVLLSKVTQRLTLPYNAFKTLGDVLNSFLNTILIYHDTNTSHVTAVLHCTGLVSTFDPPGSAFRLYLRETVSSNPVWNSKERWLGIIQSKIDRSCTSLIETRRQVNEDVKHNLVKKIWMAGAKLMNKRSSPIVSMQDYSERSSKIYSELLSIAVQLSLMHINLDMGRDILMHFALLYNVQEDKLFSLLFEYESSHSLARKKVTKNADKQRLYLERKALKAKRYANSAPMIAVRFSIAFVNDKKILLKLLMLNKSWHNIFRKCIYSNALKRSNIVERFIVWESMLHIKGLRELYIKIKSGSLKEFRQPLRAVHGMIRADVNSSLGLLSRGEKEVLFK